MTVGAIHESPADDVRLTGAGEIVQQEIRSLPQRYPELQIDHFVVMPNHIHLLLRISEERALREAPLREGGREKRSLLPKAIGYLKMNSSKKIHAADPDLVVWQRDYYEHVVRNDRDYQEIWGYIENNPSKWAEDRYYTNAAALV